MGFCLECHRNPEEYIRPPEEVYNLDWERPDTEEFKKEALGFVHDWKVNPPQSCSAVTVNHFTRSNENSEFSVPLLEEPRRPC